MILTPNKIPKKKTDRLLNLKLYFKAKKIPFESEYIFHPTRKWRFDMAFPQHKIAIEYEGIMSTKSRHTTISGYIGDCEKYNEATLLGWRILRFTTANLSSARLMIEQLMNG